MADDYKVRNYQDDFDSGTGEDGNRVKDDIITEELTDNLAKDAGVPEHVLKEEFDGMETGDSPLGTKDDIENEVEDADDEL